MKQKENVFFPASQFATVQLIMSDVCLKQLDNVVTTL